MTVTINFTASTDPDIASVKVWEATTSAGEYSLVQTTSITTASTSVTYAAGLATNWYRLSFLDTANNESDLSAAIYGDGSLWYDYMIPVFRTETDDWGATSRVSDLNIRKKLVLAASQLQNMAKIYDIFLYSYTFSIDAGDGSGWNISADPIYGSHDPNFEMLWIYKAVCDNYKASLSGATSNAIKIKDGDSSIDTTAGFGGYKALMESDTGACGLFSTLWAQIVQSQSGAGSGNAGKTKYVLANYGSDYIHRPSAFNGYGGIDRSAT